MVGQEAGIEHPLRAALQLAPFAALALAALVCDLGTPGRRPEGVSGGVRSLRWR